MNDHQLIPNKSAIVPPYDFLTEGYDPAKLVKLNEKAQKEYQVKLQLKNMKKDKFGNAIHKGSFVCFGARSLTCRVLKIGIVVDASKKDDRIGIISCAVHSWRSGDEIRHYASKISYVSLDSVLVIGHTHGSIPDVVLSALTQLAIDKGKISS